MPIKRNALLRVFALVLVLRLYQEIALRVPNMPDLAPARTFLYMQQHSMNSNVTLAQKLRRKCHLLSLSACLFHMKPSVKQRLSFPCSDTP